METVIHRLIFINSLVSFKSTLVEVKSEQFYEVVI